MTTDEDRRSDPPPAASSAALFIALAGMAFIWLGPFVSCMAFWRFEGGNEAALKVALIASLGGGIALLAAAGIALAQDRRRGTRSIGGTAVMIILVLHALAVVGVAQQFVLR
jgi:hypothetical protein